MCCYVADDNCRRFLLPELCSHQSFVQTKALPRRSRKVTACRTPPKSLKYLRLNGPIEANLGSLRLAVQGEERLVKLRPAVAEQTPRCSLSPEGIEVELGGDHRFVIPGRLRQKLTLLAGDE